MLPNKSGIWEWIDADGTKRLVHVWNVYEKYPKNEPYFRVCWGGGYYDIVDSIETLYDCNLKPIGTREKKSEWTGGTWGNYVGQLEDFNADEIYSFPDRD